MNGRTFHGNSLRAIWKTSSLYRRMEDEIEEEEEAEEEEEQAEEEEGSV